MRNIPSLKNTSQFTEVYENGTSYANKFLVLYVHQTDGEHKVGISASKKIGNSVVRHRAVRLIRESYRTFKDRIPEGCQLVIVARAKIAQASQAEVTGALHHLLKLQKLV